MSHQTHRAPSSLRIVVSGLIAQYPLGGVAWDYLQYVVGLAQLGHDVYYLEDTGQWPYDPTQGGVAKDPAHTVGYLRSIMDRFGLSDRWAYRFPWQNQWFGMSERLMSEVLLSADLIINVSGVLRRPQDLETGARLVFIDSDPVFTQVKLARGQIDFRQQVDAHHVHFSFGERLRPPVPETGHEWRPTRQPIVLSEWDVDQPGRSTYTTVMNWTSYNDVRFEGQVYGQKDVEFERFMGLPAQLPTFDFEVALSVGKTRRAPQERLRRAGWRLVDPAQCCGDLDSYRSYIGTSRGEWSIAKHGYVTGMPGWFSCRSACYLASGRPVVVQDTGFPHILPTGVGLLAFTSAEEAVGCLREVESDYARHRLAARELAATYFASDLVLSRLVADAMAHPSGQT